VGTQIIEILSEIERLKGLELKYEMEENLDDLIKIRFEKLYIEGLILDLIIYLQLKYKQYFLLSNKI